MNPGAIQFTTLFLFSTFGKKDQMIFRLQPRKGFAHARHEFNRVVVNPMFLMRDPRFQPAHPQRAGDLIERLTTMVGVGLFIAAVFIFVL